MVKPVTIKRACLILGLALGLMAVLPRPGYAFGATTVIVDIPRSIFQAVDKVAKKIATAFKTSGDIAFKSALQTFEQKLLDEAELALTASAPGQKPLFLTNPKTFFTQVADRAAGDYIDNYTRAISGGRTLGTPISGERGKFLVSQLLKNYALDTVNSQSGITNVCRQGCTQNNSTSQIDLSKYGSMTKAKFDALGIAAFPNRHAYIVAKLYNDLNRPDGSKAAKSKNSTTFACDDAIPVPSTGTAAPWELALGQTTDLPPDVCIYGQEFLFNIEQSLAQNDTNRCLQSCQAQNSALNSAIQGFTATDIFSAVKNADASNAPAALANALAEDTSDIGQFISAAGALTATINSTITGEETNLQPNALPRTSKVSGEVLTPSSATGQLFGVPIQTSNSQNTYTGTSVADILKSVTSFINSPVGRALKNYFFSKCGLNPDACKGPSNAKSTIGKLVFGSGNPTGVAGAKLLYSTLGQSQITSGDPGNNEIQVTTQLGSAGVIDTTFQQAIDQQLTVKQAVDQHLLDGQRTFGFDKNGLEPAKGYPYRSLQYLRKYRITPVGWELAAKYSQQFDHRDLSLNYLIDQYPMCGQDDQHRVCARGSNAGQSCQVDSDCGNDENGATITCGASPYCGLVDPDWVLKAPQTYCRRQGAGEEVIAKEFVCDVNNINASTGAVIAAGEEVNTTEDNGAPNCVQSTTNIYPDVGRWVVQRNTDTCADVQSCITENPDGTCVAYGYCVQERQTYKFDGQQCAPQNSSCATYTDTLGQQIAYLGNTLDSRNCTADNAGCQQYCATDSYNVTTEQCTGTNRVNFTGKVQSCDSGSVGCSQFIRTVSGTNLLANAGFETFDTSIDSANSANLAGWDKSGTLGAFPVTASDTSITTNNAAALRLSGAATDTLSQIVHLGSDLSERSFTLSLRAKADASCSALLGLAVNSGNINAPRVPGDGQPNVSIGTDWSTVNVTMTVPSTDIVNLNNVYDLKATIGLGSCATQSLTIDSAQLEVGDQGTTFADYGTRNQIYMNGQRQQCTIADVGCLAYTPTAGGATINGQVKNSNRCGADQVGCASYQLVPITATPQRSGGLTNIIAPKAQLCTAADVGCEEYTNLDEVAQGGEGKEYYSSVKQCLKPSMVTGATQSATYYTWVGDAKLGYVLRAYDLVKSNDTTSGGAPCTALSVGTTSTNPTCQDTASTIAAATCSANDLVSNPDCAQFYDSALNVYYRLRSKTVTVTNDCHPYRNTIDQSDATKRDQVYYLSTKENHSCSAAAAGCRAYRGNTSGATRQVFTDTFESTTANNWIGGTVTNAASSLNGHSMQITVSGSSTAAVTRDSVLKNQILANRTYQLTFTAAAASSTSGTITASFGRLNGSTFDPLSGAAVFPGTATATWNSTASPAGPEWRQFTLGPLTMPQNETSVQLGLSVSGGSVYVDNVTLTEVNDVVYMISTSAPRCDAANVGCAAYRDSNGQTNYLTSFSRLCAQEVVGCEAMIDTRNSSTPFTQTVKGVTTPADQIVTLVNDKSKYCSAEAKGCNVFGLANQGPDQAITGYSAKYLINDPDRYRGDLCLDNELRCSAYTDTNGATVYFKNPGSNTCEYRTSSNGSSAWFVTGTSIPCPTVVPPTSGRPVGASCSPVCADGSRQGRTCTTDADCPASSCVGSASLAGQVRDAGGQPVIGQCTNSADCLGGNTCVYQVGLCAAEENSCTEYRDPSDPTSCRTTCPLTQSQGGSADYVDANCQLTRCATGDRQGQNCQTDADCFDGAQNSCVGGNGQPSTGIPGCRSYYYLSNSLETSAGTCNGVMSTADGCIPFNDTTNPVLNYKPQ